ncbi:MAG: hypothetical protein IJU54_02115 [Alphaproteobacteria bacterium]|nr:hypothetical protein [Alphaproteobacteria bacterium]
MSNLLKLTLPLFTLLIPNAICGFNDILINQINELFPHSTNVILNKGQVFDDIFTKHKLSLHDIFQDFTNICEDSSNRLTNTNMLVNGLKPDITIDQTMSLDELLQNITQGDGKIVENYLFQYYKNKLIKTHYIINSEDDLKPHITLCDENINKTKIMVDQNEIKQFQECIKDESIKSYSLMLSDSLLNNYLYNTSKFQFVSDDKNANVFQYFNAMKNALQTSFNQNSTNKQIIKELYCNKFDKLQVHNPLLNEIADLYIDYKFNNDSGKIKDFLKDNKYNINKNSLLNNFLNFYTLGFTAIINQVVKGSLVLRNELPKLKLNNKVLTDDYNKELDDKTNYIIKMANHNIGICWFNTSVTTVLAAAINSDNKNLLQNTNFARFIKHLEEAQKDRAKEFKKKNGVEITRVEETVIAPNTLGYRTSWIEMTDQIDILEEFDKFEKQMKKERLEDWNKEPGVLRAKSELYKMINANKEVETKRIDRFKNGNNSPYNNFSGNFASNCFYGINLLTRVFPELKQILTPTYDIDTSNLDSRAEDSTCGDMIDNMISSFSNMAQQDKYKKIAYHFDSKSRPYENANVNIIKNKLTVDNLKHIKNLPEYLVVTGDHYDSNSTDRIPGMKFDTKLHEHVVGFNRKSELVIAELSSIAMHKNGAKHAYALYKGNDGWYIMDDNSKKENNLYKKLTQTEFDEIVARDKVEAFIYKKLYCNTIDKNNNNSSDNSNTTNNTKQQTSNTQNK